MALCCDRMVHFGSRGAAGWRLSDDGNEALEIGIHPDQMTWCRLRFLGGRELAGDGTWQARQAISTVASGVAQQRFGTEQSQYSPGRVSGGIQGHLNRTGDRLQLFSKVGSR